jgi:hypothetical protein
MLTFTQPLTLEQTRDVRPVYADPTDPNYTHKDFGKPVRMDASDVIQLKLSLSIAYDKDHREKVAKVLEAVHALLADADMVPKHEHS